MTPAEVKSIIAIMELIAKLGAWPFLLLIVGPWLFAVMLVLVTERNASKRHQAVIDMYVNNVRLVEEYERLCKKLDQLLQDHQAMICANTQAMTRLVDAINILKKE